MSRQELKYVFGPVFSRRLGRSLGVNTIPLKACNYSCVYCQLGRTDQLTTERRDFFPPGEIILEMQEGADRYQDEIDYVTFSGEGEPTLCKSLGDLISRAKRLTNVPVAVITNGSLMGRPDVREDLGGADVVIPSLDAADKRTFSRINRPHGRVGVEEMIEGLSLFRSHFQGKLWVEVMLVRGINDDEQSLLRIREALEPIRPHRIDLNLPVRPPAETWAGTPLEASIQRARDILGRVAPTFVDVASGGPGGLGGASIGSLLAVLRSHPLTLDGVMAHLRDVPRGSAAETLRELEEEGLVRSVMTNERVYYVSGVARR